MWNIGYRSIRAIVIGMRYFFFGFLDIYQLIRGWQSFKSRAAELVDEHID